MNTTITNINFVFDNGYNAQPTKANVSFIMSDGEFNFNGNVTLTFDEYIGVSADATATENLVKSKVVDKLTVVTSA